jgi:hypothetical protein
LNAGIATRDVAERSNRATRLLAAEKMMALLTNLKIRNKLLLALLPLALMVIVAGLYSSIENKMIDTLYSDVIEKDIKTLQIMTAARALTMRFGLGLYRPSPNSIPTERSQSTESWTRLTPITRHSLRKH